MKPSLKFRSISQGFTLLEFLVASVIGIIVIMAAGSSYFITRSLSASAQERIEIQRNLRNATAQIIRDTRIAGSFGCFNSNSHKDRNGIVINSYPTVLNGSAGSVGIKLDGKSSDGFGIRVIPKAQIATYFPPIGNMARSDMLMFVYGLGEISVTGLTTEKIKDKDGVKVQVKNIAIANGDGSDMIRRATLDTMTVGGVILSSCYDATYAKGSLDRNINSNNLRIINPQQTSFPEASKIEEQMGTLTVSKLHATAYVLLQDKTNTTNLYRYELLDNGTWDTLHPQLISTDVKSMKTEFGYIVHGTCPLTANPKAGTNNNANSNGGNGNGSTTKPANVSDEKFVFYNQLPTHIKDPYNELPAMVRVTLRYNPNAQLDHSGKKIVTPDADYIDYSFNATVRGGNYCSLRNLTDK